MKDLFRIRLILLATLTVVAGPVLADVYMWQDADGTVHYGDKPGTREATKLDIQTRSTDKAAVTERYQERQSARLESNAASAERRATKEQQEADAAKQRAEKEARCEKARERLTSYINSRRLYRVDESGERQYLDDAQIDEARAKAEEAVTEHCN